MYRRLTRILIIFSLILFFVTNSFSEEESNLEERVTIIEEEIEKLKMILSDISSSTGIDDSDKSVIKDVFENTSNASPISVELVTLAYHDSNASNNWANDYSDWISFTFIFTNNLKKPIRAAKGSIVFMDLFGNEWWEIGLSINQPIEPEESINWVGQIDYNGFIESHKTARRSDPSSVKVRYDVTNLLFKDGTQERYE